MDLIYLAATAAFFLASAGPVRLCAALGGDRGVQR
jgi:hypothetical protein